MSRYLTNKAQKRKWWEIPVLAATGALSAAIIGTCVDMLSEEMSVYTIIAGVVLLLIFGTPFVKVMKRFVRRAQARKLARELDSRGEGTLLMTTLARTGGMLNAPGVLKKLIEESYIQNVSVDEAKRRFVMFPAEPEAPAQPLSEVLCPACGTRNRVINVAGAVCQACGARLDLADFDGAVGGLDFRDKLKEIRELNDAIADAPVSKRIDRIEELTIGFYQAVRENPERAPEVRRFMNYYLPMTFKLLKSYSMMEKQSYQGEVIRTSRKQIENVLDTLVGAIEKQQDKLFRSDQLDVETDISVLETLLAADGLTDRGQIGAN